MKRAKTLVGFIIFAVIVYAGWTLVPVYVAYFQFQDEITTIAKFAALNNQTEEMMRDQVMKKAADLGIPLAPENLKIYKDQDQATINANYNVVINLPNGKQYTIAFTPSSKQKTQAGANK